MKHQHPLLAIFTSAWRALATIIQRYPYYWAGVILFFVVSIVIGGLLPVDIKKDMMRSLTELIASVFSEQQSVLALRIFLNNLYVGVLLLLLGVFIVVPAILLLFNGLMIGVVFSLMPRFVSLGNVTLGQFILAFVPHGLIELPAILLCAGLGTLLGCKLFFGRWFWKDITRKELIKKVALIFLVLLVPAFFVAAFIETYVTPGMAGLGGEDQQTLDVALLSSDEVEALAPGFYIVEAQSALYTALNDNSNFLLEFLFNDVVIAAWERVETPTVNVLSITNGTASLVVSVQRFSTEEQADHGKDFYLNWIKESVPLAEFGYNGEFTVTHANTIWSTQQDQKYLQFSSSEGMPLDMHNSVSTAQFTVLQEFIDS